MSTVQHETPNVAAPMSAAPEEVEPTGPMRAFELTVSRVQALTEHFRRITFVGQDLKLFGANKEGLTLDLRIKVLIPAPGKEVPKLLTNNGSLLDPWYLQWRDMDPAERGVMRTYTVRDIRRDADGKVAELDIDFVLHLEGGSGPAAEWAADAMVGDPMTLVGPCANWKQDILGIEFAPGTADRLLLAGDETAIPAIAAILESLPAHVAGHAVLEVPTSSDFLDIATPAQVELRWHARNGRTHGELMEADVRNIIAPTACDLGEEPTEVDVDAEILWETPEAAPTAGLYAWIAGEASAIRSLRRYLVKDVGMDRGAVAFMGYWRHGRALPE